MSDQNDPRDTEGHRITRSASDDDTEGNKWKHLDASDDDTEGHVMLPGATRPEATRPEATSDDDTEGHRLTPSAHQPD
jgi:hypothetical protein